MWLIFLFYIVEEMLYWEDLFFYLKLIFDCLRSVMYVLFERIKGVYKLYRNVKSNFLENFIL